MSRLRSRARGEQLNGQTPDGLIFQLTCRRLIYTYQFRVGSLSCSRFQPRDFSLTPECLLKKHVRMMLRERSTRVQSLGKMNSAAMELTKYVSWSSRFRLERSF